MKKETLVSGLIVCCLFTFHGTFTACSSDDETQTSYGNDETSRVEAAKAKVLNLAEKYGLNFKIDNESIFREEVLANKLNLDSVELDFRKFARLKGHYSFLAIKGNRITLNTRIEQMLKRRAKVLRTRDVFSGSFDDGVSSGMYTLSYNVMWSYDTDSASGTVSLENFRLEGINDGDYNDNATEISNFVYQFVGAVPSFTYKADLIVYKFSGSGHLSFKVSGGYSTTGGYYSNNNFSNTMGSSYAVIE